MQIQSNKEAFHKACRKEETTMLRHAILDFTSERLFASNGSILACKPLLFDQGNKPAIKGPKLINQHVLPLTQNQSVRFDVALDEIEVPGLGTFPFEEVDHDVEKENNVDVKKYKPIPNVKKIADELTQKQVKFSVTLNAKNLKTLLDTIGAKDNFQLFFFENPDRENGIDDAVGVQIQPYHETHSMGCIMQVRMEDEWNGFTNNLTPENAAKRFAKQVQTTQDPEEGMLE